VEFSSINTHRCFIANDKEDEHITVLRIQTVFRRLESDGQNFIAFVWYRFYLKNVKFSVFKTA